ncbi:MAG: CpXC domain-containing protein [Eubacterium sp.]|nr:CpXC domain-containing protein [Eubacterium sp.]
MNENRMTAWREEEIPCPRCGQLTKVKKYHIINASEKPSVKKEILKNKIYFFECDNCSLSAPLTYPSIYLDSKKKLAFLLSPELGEETDDLCEGLGDLTGYKRRYVDNINDLKEKIMIFENRLDDRVIELTKIEYIRQLEKEMKDDELMNILFDYSGNDMYMMVFFQKKGVGRIPLNLEFYRQIENQYARRLPVRPSEEFEKIDLEWAGNIVLQRN